MNQLSKNTFACLIIYTADINIKDLCIVLTNIYIWTKKSALAAHDGSVNGREMHFLSHTSTTKSIRITENTTPAGVYVHIIHMYVLVISPKQEKHHQLATSSMILTLPARNQFRRTKKMVPLKMKQDSRKTKDEGEDGDVELQATIIVTNAAMRIRLMSDW